MRNLADVLLRASLIAAPFSLACVDDEGGTDRFFASRAQHAEQIDRCIADENDCNALCWSVLIEQGGNTSTGASKELDHCELVETRPDGLLLDITWFPYEDTACGRRPHGFHAGPVSACGAGAWLARIATLEAASVTAFARLVRSLRRLHAPAALVAAARSAVGDEITHARMVARLALRRGVMPEAPVIEKADEPTLAELARHNAIEGQVGETFGALVATCQSRLARDVDVRRAFRTIAADETRHAELSSALAAWLEPQLACDELDAVRAGRADAVAAIRGDFGLSARDRAALGVPEPARLRAAAAIAFGGSLVHHIARVETVPIVACS